MFTKHEIYYTIERADDSKYSFICSFATFNEASMKLNELKANTESEYRILKIEKDIEEVS